MKIAGVPPATAPQNTLRQDLKLNDMRDWTPQVPMLLSGARQDHNVLDAIPAAADPYAAMKSGFQQWVSQSLSVNGSLTMLTNYHGVAACFCLQSAYQYFGKF